MGALHIDRREGGVHVFTLANEAKRNAVDPELLEALRSAAVASDAEGARCLVLTGEGPRAFCSGYDLRVLREKGGSEERLPDVALQETLHALERAAPPVIAAVNGAAFGAGGELAVACDLRIAAENATIAMPPARLGIVYAPEGLQRFVELVGLSRAKRLFFTGDPIGASEALELGLVDEVVPEGQALDRAVELAERIARNSPRAVQGMKRILTLMRRRELPAAAVAEVEALRRASFASEDAQEGIAAVLERREPRFSGR
ncbi:enoyl-CoA hydratase/isomerase family protein [Vulgatibacter incomptus]|uniref:Enoyl-CoA hydratase n=1 Tax=Vulgatibacter incomptus TaxID=1391653 RepID=A0A0K1PEL1_9BACT|nr:enoyl-CoA hydratase/isomerase family protein [Vulgatibacter incomptus]AKU91851.1 Enoyl-CoA hydratase [Vulgatibacter incomptus]